MDAPETLYGSDKQGLVWGYVFTPGESARQNDCAGAVDLLAMGEADEKNYFVWLHFSLSNTSTVPWLKLHLTPPDVFFDEIHETVEPSPFPTFRWGGCNRCEAQPKVAGME